MYVSRNFDRMPGLFLCRFLFLFLMILCFISLFLCVWSPRPCHLILSFTTVFCCRLSLARRMKEIYSNLCLFPLSFRLFISFFPCVCLLFFTPEVVVVVFFTTYLPTSTTYFIYISHTFRHLLPRKPPSLLTSVLLSVSLDLACSPTVCVSRAPVSSHLVVYWCSDISLFRSIFPILTLARSHRVRSFALTQIHSFSEKSSLVCHNSYLNVSGCLFVDLEDWKTFCQLSFCQHRRSRDFENLSIAQVVGFELALSPSTNERYEL